MVFRDRSYKRTATNRGVALSYRPDRTDHQECRGTLASPPGTKGGRDIAIEGFPLISLELRSYAAKQELLARHQKACRMRERRLRLRQQAARVRWIVDI